jgi:prophage regulatory protein
MNSNAILRFPEIQRRTGLSRSTIWRRIQQKTFPAPVALGGRAVGWRAAEVDAWIESLPAVTREA